MPETLVIFGKDVKRLWPLGATMSLLVILHGGIDLRLEHSYLVTLNARGHRYEPWLLFIVWWCLAAVLVQQERTVGDRQYWITRPIPRGSLIAAKALFFGAFVCVPSFLCQAAVRAITGFPLSHYLAALVWNQVLIFVDFVMAAAFAAVTRNFRLYALTSLALFATFIFVSEWAVNRAGGQWGGVQWAQEIATEIVVLAQS